MDDKALNALHTLSAYVEDDLERGHPQYMGPNRTDALEALDVLRIEWAVRHQEITGFLAETATAVRNPEASREEIAEIIDRVILKIASWA